MFRPPAAPSAPPIKWSWLPGHSAAFQMIAALLLDPGNHVWLEDPGYPGARSALTQAGARIVPVHVDGQGLDVAAATRRAPAARLAYVTPSNQFPLGVPMSLMRRLALLKWASSAGGAWIVEDDYDSEFRSRRGRCHACTASASTAA